MKWASVLSGPEVKLRKQTEGQAFVESCAVALKEKLGTDSPDLLVAFVSGHFKDTYERVPELIYKHLKPKAMIGCSALGLIGGGVEVEQEPAISFTGAVMPGVAVKSFHIEDGELPDLDDPPHCWEELVGVPSHEEPNFLLLPDPFSFRIDVFVEGLDYAFSKAVKVGGLASGGSRIGSHALFKDKSVHRTGLVGVAVSGNIVVDSIVAQGCRPIAKAYRVTKCHQNILFELDGKPAVHVLKEVIEALSPRDQDLARTAIFMGVAMDEFKDDPGQGDFLIRNIVGIEPTSGALVIGELLRKERTVQFHLRDAATSDDDLRFMLKRYLDDHSQASDKALGAILFSCTGRGQHLYGSTNHDSNCFQEYLGEVPLGGFFCNGEIGPVGGSTFLHGFTSSFGIFRDKAPK